MMSAAVHRWSCPHCNATGYGWVMPAHDRPAGGSCRPSGQRPETEISKQAILDLAIRMAKDTASREGETAKGRWAIARLVELEAQNLRSQANPGGDGA